MSSGFIGGGRFGSGSVAGAGAAAGGGGGGGGGGGATDANFPNVGALLHFNGTNGATATTDSSGHVLAVTVGGACALDTSQKKYGSASMAFTNANSDRLSLPGDSSAVDLTTGDWTIEAWVRLSATDHNQGILHCFNGSTFQQYSLLAISVDGAGSPATLQLNVYDSGSTPFTINGGTIAIDTWTHVAATRAGDVFRLFVDGVRVGTNITTLTGDLANDVDPMVTRMGGLGFFQGNRNLQGWLDDVRITKGVARYTADFTAPTAEFPDSGDGVVFGDVQWMSHFNGSNNGTTFTESSAHAWPLDRNSSSAVTSTAQKKYGTASLLLNGSDCVLGGSGTIVSDQAAGMQLNTGVDFCIEAWIYPTTISDSTPHIIFNLYNYSSAGVPARLLLNDGASSAANLHGFLKDGSATTILDLASTGTPVVCNQWQHVAFTRAAGTYRLFLDGVKVAEGTDNGGTQVTTKGYPSVGGNPYAATNGFIGYIDDVRFSTGKAVYTADFTPPSAQFPDA